MKHWISALIEAALAWAIFGGILLVWAAVATPATLPQEDGPVCPATYPECLQRDVLDDLEQAGAEPYELQAVARLLRHSHRGMTAYVRVSQREIALSWPHLTACRDRLWHEACDPTLTSLTHYWTAMELLYSDAAGRITLDAWRRVVGPVVREAHAAGWPEERLDLVAAAANSAPSEVRRIGRACAWGVECTISGWTTTERRRERMR